MSGSAPKRISVVFVVAPDVLVTLSDEVRGQAWTVRFATTAEDGWEGVSLLSPDVVVIDLRLGADVAEALARRVRDDARHHHVALLGLVSAEDVATDTLADFDTWLGRAVTEERVIALVESLAALARARGSDA